MSLNLQHCGRTLARDDHLELQYFCTVHTEFLKTVTDRARLRYQKNHMALEHMKHVYENAHKWWLDNKSVEPGDVLFTAIQLLGKELHELHCELRQKV